MDKFALVLVALLARNYGISRQSIVVGNNFRMLPLDSDSYDIAVADRIRVFSVIFDTISFYWEVNKEALVSGEQRSLSRKETIAWAPRSERRPRE